MFAPYKETVDELESHFQVNYLSHLYLTQALIGILEDSATEDCHARVINVSSIVHNVGSLSLQSIGKRYDAFNAGRLGKVVLLISQLSNMYMFKKIVDFE